MLTSLQLPHHQFARPLWIVKLWARQGLPMGEYHLLTSDPNSSHSSGKPTVTLGPPNNGHKPDSTREPINAHKSTDVDEPVNIRMQNPHYVAGAPLFARDPSARHVVHATAGLAHQATFPQSVGNKNNLTGIGSQFESTDTIS